MELQTSNIKFQNKFQIRTSNIENWDFRFVLKFEVCILMFALMLSACSGSQTILPGEVVFEEVSGDVGYLQLNLSNTTGAITHYQIKIEGEGFEPKEETLSKEAGGVAIEGIPAGPNRRIQVLALNKKGQTLREGILEGVAITPGEIASLNIILQAVPVVLNFGEGDYQSNRRLFFSVLTDPGDRIALRETAAYTDILSGRETVEADSQGLVRFYPGILPAGPHTFEVIDFDSGKSSQVSLHLWDGGAIGPAPLWAASSTTVIFGGLP